MLDKLRPNPHWAGLPKPGRQFFVHEVCASGRGPIPEQVVENLRLHRAVLCGRIELGDALMLRRELFHQTRETVPADA